MKYPKQKLAMWSEDDFALAGEITSDNEHGWLKAIRSHFADTAIGEYITSERLSFFVEFPLVKSVPYIVASKQRDQETTYVTHVRLRFRVVVSASPDDMAFLLLNLPADCEITSL